MRIARIVSLALAWMLVAPSSGAQTMEVSSGKAFVSNFGYTLVDLDVNDGIAPSLNMLGVRNDTFAYSGYSDDPVFLEYSTGPAPLAATWSDGNSFITAGVDGMSPTGTELIYATGSTHNGRGDWTGVYTDHFFEFSLSPRTAVVFFAAYELSTFSHIDPRAGFGQARVRGDLEARGATGGFGYDSQIESLFTSDGSEFDSGILNLSYANWQAGAATGEVQFQVGAGTRWHHIAEIPEPASYGMMVAGLVLLGVCARRARG